MTTLNEGDTLYLDCDTSNSRPRPSVEWLSPDGVTISITRDLGIMNIQRSAAVIYTCVALSRSGATINSTVNVTVQCKCSMIACMKLVHAHKCFYRGKRKQEKVKLYQYNYALHIFVLCFMNHHKIMSAVCMLLSMYAILQFHVKLCSLPQTS